MKSRRLFLKQGSLATAAILATKPFKSFAGNINRIAGINILESHIAILHTGNLYSQLLPVADNSLYHGLGGFENTGSMIASLKKQLPNVVLLDAGNHAADKSNGSTEETNALMQHLGYDAVAARTAHTALPLIADNKDAFKIIEKGAIRIGVISTETVDNNIPRINELANNVKAEYKCNLIICLSSMGYKKNNADDDHALAASSKNIDIILGAADHTFMKTPDIAQNQDKNEVVINHTGYAGVVLGKLDISFDERGNKKAITFDNLMIGTPNHRWIKTTA